MDDIEYLEDIKNEMCDNYCKYPNEYDPEQNDGVDLCDSDICENCPLNRLIYGE